MKVFENADKSESISNDMGSDFLFAKVIIDISHTSVDKEYTYIVPKNLRKEGRMIRNEKDLIMLCSRNVY